MPSLKPAGATIRRRRQERGLKASELAAAIRVSPVHLYNIETGHNGASIEVLYRIADALSLSIDEVSTSGDAA